jgi:hypothetical protein
MRTSAGGAAAQACSDRNASALNGQELFGVGMRVAAALV